MHRGLCKLLANFRYPRSHTHARNRGSDQDTELLAQDAECPLWNEAQNQDRADGHRG